jgi:hypothetical protein
VVVQKVDNAPCEVLGLVVRDGSTAAVVRAVRERCRRLGFTAIRYERRAADGVVRLARTTELRDTPSRGGHP